MALYKQGKIREAAVHFQKAWESEDRIKDDYTQDIKEYKDLFQKVRGGHRPSIDFYPRVRGNCYMFGCIHHGRPMHEE